MNNAYPPPASLIDHRSTMMFVDALQTCDETTAHCSATVRADNPFLVADRLPNWVLVEYIAQSVALFAGYRRRLDNVPRRHGLLLGCRSMNLAGAGLRVGDRLELFVEEIVRLDNFGRFNGQARCRDAVVAEGVLSVLETESWPDPAATIA